MRLVGYAGAVAAYAALAITAPVYVPVCLGMWTYFYFTNMQDNSDYMLSLRLDNREH